MTFWLITIEVMKISANADTDLMRSSFPTDYEENQFNLVRKRNSKHVINFMFLRLL